MVVSQPSPSPSMILTDLPAPAAEAVSRVVALFDKHVGSGEGPDDFEAAERDALSAMKDVCCLVLRSVIESRDDGAGRIERDGQVWYRVEETAKMVMTSLGAVEYRRPRYRRDGASSSIVPVDESLGLVNGCLTRTAAHLGVWLMGHCTSREAEAFFGKMGTMTPSASTLQRLVKAAHGSWETIGATALDTIRAAEGIPADAVTAAVSLDGIMVPLRAGEDGRAEACWREASCGTVSFHDSDGERLHTLYLGRMPESGKVSLKAQLRAEVAHIKACRPDIEIVALADGAPDNWSFLETLSPMAEVVDFWHACEHLSAASDHAVARNWYEKYRENPAPRCGRGGEGHPRPASPAQQGHLGEGRDRARVGVLPQEPASDALSHPEGPQAAHRLGRGRSRQQDADHTAHEALRHALEDPRRAGRSERPRAHQIRALRARLGGLGLDRHSPCQ